MGVLRQHTVKIQMNIFTVFSILRDLKLRLYSGLTTVLTILQFTINTNTNNKPTNPTPQNLFTCFSLIYFSFLNLYHDLLGFPGVSVVREADCQCKKTQGSIPGLGRSCRENFMDRGTQWAVAIMSQSWTWRSTYAYTYTSWFILNYRWN